MNNQIHLRTVSIVAAFLAIAMAVLGLGMTALPANAATLPDAEITLTTESVVSSQWDQVDLSCEWSVPDHSQPGDTFSVQLPPQLRWFGKASFDLDNSNGDTVATAVANDAGLVVFTLSDFVKTHPLNVGGTCSFSTQYSQVPTVGDTEELTFTVGSSVVRVPVAVEPCQKDCGPEAPTAAGKSMSWVDPAQTELRSVFTMPAMTADTNDVVVTDTPAAGMDIDCARVTPRIGQVVGSDGGIVEPYDNDQYPAAIDCSPEKATVTWTGLPEGEHVELFVVTRVTDPSLAVYENTGTVTIAGTESPVVAQLRRTEAGGTGHGTAVPTPTPTATTATPTPSATPTPAPSATTATPTPTATTATPTTAPAVTSTPVASTSSPILVVPTEQPSEPAETEGPDQLASTGAQGTAFIFVAAALLAVGSLLAFASARRKGRRAN